MCAYTVVSVRCVIAITPFHRARGLIRLSIHGGALTDDGGVKAAAADGLAVICAHPFGLDNFALCMKGLQEVRHVS